MVSILLYYILRLHGYMGKGIKFHYSVCFEASKHTPCNFATAIFLTEGGYYGKKDSCG
jgi:hypothetical protein